MKALKTVAVALGITLAALIVIPLVVLAGLFVWLKLTEEDEEELARARSRRRLDRRPETAAPDGEAVRPSSTPAGDPAGVSVSPARPARHGRVSRRAPRSPRSASSASWSCGPATSSSSSRRSTSCRRSASRSSGSRSPRSTLFALLRWREGSVGLPRRDLLAIAGLGALGFGDLPDPLDDRPPTVPAGDSALIIASTPVLVAFLAVARPVPTS